MAVNSETEINLKTLQRVDSNIDEIIDNASQVAIYKYERKLNKWEGTDIEGTLFLYKRSLYPFHGFIIVNRMSTTNFIEAITSDMEFVQHEPYFLYKKSCGEIIGTWFYDERDFRRITNKIQSIVLKQTTPPRRQRCFSDSDSQLKKDDAVQDIMSMLSQAHIEYIKSETTEPVLERNGINENCNDLSTYSENKLSNKSLKTNASNHSFSSHEKYPMSPRRRFLSTGSCDSPQQFPFFTRNITNELTRQSGEADVLSEVGNVKKLKDEPRNVDEVHVFPLTLENVENFSAPTRLSPLFSQEEISSPTLSGVDFLDHMESTETPVKPNYCDLISSNVMQKSDLNGHWLKNDVYAKAENSMHSSILKETLKTHIQFDSNIMLEIHEAYIESLKSLFTLKKS